MERNKLITIELRKGDIDRIIMALEEWGEGQDIIESLEAYASSYMGGNENKQQSKLFGNCVYFKDINKEIEIEVHDKGKSYDELKKIYGEDFEKKLLTKEECEIILKNSEMSKLLKMDGSSFNDDFFIQQFDEQDRKRGHVAVFYVGGVAGFIAGSGGAILLCDGDSGCTDSHLGVRFCRRRGKSDKQRV